MTVGDERSTGYIKPEVVRIIVDKLREQGARPFVFDTNVIYSGQRQNAVDHLNLAYRKGFTPDRLGCLSRLSRFPDRSSKLSLPFVR